MPGGRTARLGMVSFAAATALVAGVPVAALASTPDPGDSAAVLEICKASRVSVAKIVR